jgi:hypothetical protein
VTGETVHILGRLSPETVLELLGRFRVRDFPEPIELHRVVSPGLPDRPLPPRVRPADGHNLLPVDRPLFGREDELAVLGAVARPGRVVTIVGPGGIGKIRLALEHGLWAWIDGRAACGSSTWRR